jgi:WD40 repeat protein
VFSPDGGRIVTVSSDNTARLWEAFPDPKTLVDRAKAEVPRVSPRTSANVCQKIRQMWRRLQVHDVMAIFGAKGRNRTTDTVIFSPRREVSESISEVLISLK